jgi:methyl-accepting chemotaxis protein
MTLREPGLKAKITIAMVVPSAVALILTVGALYARKSVMQTFASVDNNLETIVQAKTIEEATARMQDDLRGFLLTGSESFLDSYSAAKQDMLQQLAAFRNNLAHSPEAVKSLEAIKGLAQEWDETIARPAIERRKKAKSGAEVEDVAASVLTGKEKKHFDDLRAHLGALVKSRRDVLAQLRESAQQNHHTTQWVLVSAVLLWVLWNFWFWYRLSRSITTPLNEAADLAEAITHGDLSHNLLPRGNDQIGRLVTALNQMVSKLRDQTGLTLEGIHVLTESANRIYATAARLAEGTTKTSSAVTETTATFEEVKQSAKVSSEKARKVAEDSQRAVQISEAGKRATEEALMRMNLIKGQMESIGETVVRLSEHSQAIEVIVNAVQDIAEQSNLLAVNASIEAARAGDQGKGFAVVAHEIKTLADQSRDATDQVRAILQETRKWISAVVMATEQGGKAVEAGVHQSNVAGEAIQVLSSTVSLSSQAATVIDTSTEQQFVGLDQVAGGMASIEQAMRENLDGTLELERAARSLQDLAGTLNELLRNYRV